VACRDAEDGQETMIKCDIFSIALQFFFCFFFSYIPGRFLAPFLSISKLRKKISRFKLPATHGTLHLCDRSTHHNISQSV
jgi:hypothetical protein